MFTQHLSSMVPRNILMVPQVVLAAFFYSSPLENDLVAAVSCPFVSHQSEVLKRLQTFTGVAVNRITVEFGFCQWKEFALVLENILYVAGMDFT